jgi:hypothetical protein
MDRVMLPAGNPEAPNASIHQTLSGLRPRLGQPIMRVVMTRRRMP